MNRANPLAAIGAIVAGALISGICAVWGAVLAGHDTRAAYPFPDLFGVIVFLIGAFASPLAVVGLVRVVRAFKAKSQSFSRLSTLYAVLFFGPLLSIATGCIIQSFQNSEETRANKFRTQQREAYSEYATWLTADPSIALREKWYEGYSGLLYHKDLLLMRHDAFRDSFDPRRMTVAYTSEQLREISEKATEYSLYVVCHPECPRDLLETMWPLVFSSGQASLITGMLENPSTPTHLFEEYKAKHLDGKKRITGWERIIEERLENDL
jgi:hypothetical protein